MTATPVNPPPSLIYKPPAPPAPQPKLPAPDSTIITYTTIENGEKVIHHTYINTAPPAEKSSLVESLKSAVSNKYVWLAVAAIVLVGYLMRR